MTNTSLLILHPHTDVHKMHTTSGISLHFRPRDFYTLTTKLRNEFTQIIDDISSSVGNSPDWWVCPLGSRNGLVSESFLNFCYLRYALEVSSKNKIDLIICHSETVAKAIRACQGVNAKVEIHPETKRQQLKTYLVRRIGWLLFAKGCVFRWFFSKKINKCQRLLNTKNLRLIDVFVDEDRLIDGCFHDRYYGSFLSDTQSSCRWTYFPTFNRTQSYRQLFYKLANNSIPFLLKETYLKSQDYLWSLLHCIRIKRMKIPQVLYDNMDISCLFEADLKANQYDTAAMEALLNYRFAQRLSECDIKPKLLLDWFEGQSVDKGLELGFHKFQPQCFRVGYQAFAVTANYMCDRPTKAEARIGVVPHLVAVMGDRLRVNVTEFNEKISTMIAPAFRFANASKQISMLTRPNIFMIALPIGWHEIDDILSFSSIFAETAENAGLKVCLKPHPTSSSEEIRIRSKDIFPIVTDTFDKIQDQVAILVSNTSSILLEAVVQGTPAIVLGSSTQMTHNPLPADVPQELWRICFTAEEIKDSVKYLLQERWERDSSKTSINLRDRYFSPSNPRYNQSFAENIIKLSEQSI